VLKIGVDGAQELAPRGLPAANHRGGETRLAVAPDQPQLGDFGGQRQGQFGGPVAAVVVHDDDLVRLSK